MGGRTVWGMEIRSAVVGAFATVAVAGLVFTAVAVSNAAEPAPVADVSSGAVVGHYSTVESQDPIEYVPEPVAVVVPEVAVEVPEPIITEEPAVEQPANPEPLPAPAGAAPLPPPPPVLPPVEIPPPDPVPPAER